MCKDINDLKLAISATCDSQVKVLFQSVSRAASAQSFTLWQQATERDHSVIACSRHVYMGVILRTHPVLGEAHIQCNTNRDVAAVSAF